MRRGLERTSFLVTMPMEVTLSTRRAGFLFIARRRVDITLASQVTLDLQGFLFIFLVLWVMVSCVFYVLKASKPAPHARSATYHTPHVHVPRVMPRRTPHDVTRARVASSCGGGGHGLSTSSLPRASLGVLTSRL